MKTRYLAILFLLINTNVLAETARFPPKYPETAKNNHWTGSVELKIELTKEGFIKSISVEKSSGHNELDQAAIEAINKWKWDNKDYGKTLTQTLLLRTIVKT